MRRPPPAGSSSPPKRSSQTAAGSSSATARWPSGAAAPGPAARERPGRARAGRPPAGCRGGPRRWARPRGTPAAATGTAADARTRPRVQGVLRVPPVATRPRKGRTLLPAPPAFRSSTLIRPTVRSYLPSRINQAGRWGRRPSTPPRSARPMSPSGSRWMSGWARRPSSMSVR